MVVGLGLAAVPAPAQVGPPISLNPPPAGPLSTGDAAPPPAAPTGMAPGTGDDAGSITETPLAPVDGSWTGTLQESDGGLPQAMWHGTARPFLLAALPQLTPTTSPALQSLARRLLASNAMAPAGDDPQGQPGLLSLRLDRLLAFGLVDDTVALLPALPDSATDDLLDRDRVETRFAANDVAGACRDVQDRIARYQGYWWDKALIACQALAGDSTKASLGLSLLREQKAPADPNFEALIDTLGGHLHRIDKLPDPSALHLALLAATKQSLPADALASAGPAALHGWATNDAIPPANRLAAAEKAALFGALPAQGLADLYGGIEPKDDGKLPKDGHGPDDPRRRAALFNTARTAPGQNARIQAVAALLADGRKHGTFALMARVTAPLIADLPPATDPADFANEAARALLVADEAQAALPWIAATGDKGLLLVRHFAVSGSSPDEAAVLLQDAVGNLPNRQSPAAARQANLLIALVQAFGEPTGSWDSSPLLVADDNAPMPSAALWMAQQQASTTGRLGETVLSSLLIAGTGDHLSTEPIVIARVVTGLRAVGLDADARAVAVEAAIAAGL